MRLKSRIFLFDNFENVFIIISLYWQFKMAYNRGVFDRTGVRKTERGKI